MRNVSSVLVARCFFHASKKTALSTNQRNASARGQCIPSIKDMGLVATTGTKIGTYKAALS